MRRYANQVKFIPVRPMQEMRGFLRGMNTTIVREDDRLIYATAMRFKATLWTQVDRFKG